MAVASAQASVTNTATLLTTGEGDSQAAVIRNRGAASVFVGPSGVTTGTGFEVSPGDVLSVDLGGGETIYAIAAAAGPYRVDVLRSGVG